MPEPTTAVDTSIPRRDASPAGQIVRGMIQPVAFTAAALLVLEGVAELYLRSGEIRESTAGLAFGFAAAVALSGVGMRRLGSSRHQAHLGGFVLAALLGLYAGGYSVLTNDPTHVTSYALLILGVGIFFLDVGWFLGTVALVFGVWAGGTVMTGSSPDLQTSLTLIGATVISGLAIMIRIRVYRHLNVLRSEAVAKARALSESEERYSLALSGSNDGLYDWDIESNQVYYSQRLSELIGRPDMGMDETIDFLTDRIHPEDSDRVKVRLITHLRGEEPYFEDEFRLRHEDGSYMWVLARGASIRDESGTSVRMAGSVTDMTRRGVFDPLTGLPNRRLFLDRLRRVTARKPEPGDEEGGFAVLFLDLDNFKAINDTLGHQSGDDLLKAVAGRLQTCVRASDTVARLGGDEFVVLLEQVRIPVGVQITLDRIVTKLSQPYSFGGRELHVLPSIGVVMDTEHYNDPDELLRDADTAMYTAKESDEVSAIFDPDMREALRHRLELERELREALIREEFTLHFQSIVSLVDGSIEGYEALARWNHPTRGLLHPAEFIPVMEETGLVVPLGHWVLRSACEQMAARFKNTRPEEMPFVSVNLSGKHLSQETLVPTVEKVLNDTGLSGSRLRLELTETAIIENPRRAASQLGQLKLLGVQILMDDFGTGHSSLSYLQNLPIDTLKIDRSFIAQMTRDEDGSELVRTIIRMGQSLGLRIVAEGIETTEQVSLLQGMDCTSGQGYLFAVPGELTNEGITEPESDSRSPSIKRSKPRLSGVTNRGN